MCCIKQKSLGYKKSYFDIICTHIQICVSAGLLVHTGYNTYLAKNHHHM